MNRLLGIDGTEGSFEALDEAVRRTQEGDDELTVAIVDRDDVEATPAAIEQRVRDELAEAGVDADVRTLAGHPGSQLVEVADSEGFDRLVVAGGERSSLGKIHFDETLEFVLLNAQTTVTLVR